MGQSSISTNKYIVSYYEIKKDLSAGFEDGYVSFNNEDVSMRLAFRFWHKKMLTGKDVYDIASSQYLCHKEHNKTNHSGFNNNTQSSA